jgi:hypothetical protein
MFASTDRSAPTAGGLGLRASRVPSLVQKPLQAAMYTGSV